MAPVEQRYPLYDPRFEHDACGVGFVAATTRADRRRVLPLALAGLGQLGHRGAFAADGESSDGAGVALPLEQALLEHILPGTRGRPAVAMLFLPTDPVAAARARRLVKRSLTLEGLNLAGWRVVPVDETAVGQQARTSMPAIVQAVIFGPRGDTPRRRALLLARRRMEIAAARTGLTDFAVVSASADSIVYKALVAGSGLANFFHDLDTDVVLSYAVFHQRYATNTSPTWGLAQPFRLISHNGEINTVRGNREDLRGRRADLGGGFGRRLREMGELLTARGSDSLSLDEALDLLRAAGWPIETALLLAMPEAVNLRTSHLTELDEFRRRTEGLLAPWDGPAAIVFADGRRVGVVLDRNGLRPASVTITHSGLVAVASEAGAVPLTAAETRDRIRLGPGEMLLVDPGRGKVMRDDAAKAHAAGWLNLQRTMKRSTGAATIAASRPTTPTSDSVTRSTPDPVRWQLGLDAERLRLDIKTMTIEGHEPLWSMGDDTPTPAMSRVERPVVDHLRQSFAQVTNPAIDPDRERIVMDLSVRLGRRPPLLARAPDCSGLMHLESPILASTEQLSRTNLVILDATWDQRRGQRGLRTAVMELAASAVSASRSGAEVLVISDRAAGTGRLPIPSVLAVGVVHTQLADVGRRGLTDIVAEAGDALDVHGAAMTLACGARAVVPWLAVELAAELAGTRGAEEVSTSETVGNLVAAFELGLRKVLARMGISSVASYVGAQLFEVIELDADLAGACFPAAPAWHGSIGFKELATRQLERRARGVAYDGLNPARLPDPGFARFRADGEHHLFAPAVVKAVQAMAGSAIDMKAGADPTASSAGSAHGTAATNALSDYRIALTRQPALIRDQLVISRAPSPLPLDQVEPAQAILSRFVGAAMSLGALSPEAHQTLTIGLRGIGAAPNTGEGGEDPAWYDDIGGVRRDAAIKQVASARFGVTATYLARAEQLEIKIAQGSKPGEGGQLPARKVTPLIATLRRAQPGQSLISPPPHHDIYSIEDLAQLIADLRAINPGARIGVKLVASLGIGTIAAGVAKAGADYVHISGHSGGTGASPLSSIKHVGIAWELGLAEVHQVLLRNGLRDRVSLRTDGGLQTGRDVLIAALLGAEEYGFGTAALVALGCDMARQCHLDTCPTGIATQREDLRAKFTGRPEHVRHFFQQIAEDVRRELATAGLASLADAIGASGKLEAAADTRATVDLHRLISAPAWPAGRARRNDPASARLDVSREPASPTEVRLAGAYATVPHVVTDPVAYSLEHADASYEEPAGGQIISITTADRSFGAHVSGLIEKGIVRRPVRWRLKGSAGQSFGAFLGPTVELHLVGQGNDYLAKGLSGGVVVVRPEDELLDRARELAIAGNTCLYGATAGRLHAVGRAGMRFAVRNSGALAVVEGIGAHGCEYMTGGCVVILGPVGRNLGAGMTGGRIYLWDPLGDRVANVDSSSVVALRLEEVASRDDGLVHVEQLRQLLEQHREAGSLLARELLERRAQLGGEFWLVEPLVSGASPALAVAQAPMRSVFQHDQARAATPS